jgi:hypothetical protein
MSSVAVLFPFQAYYSCLKADAVPAVKSIFDSRPAEFQAADFPILLDLALRYPSPKIVEWLQQIER